MAFTAIQPTEWAGSYLPGPTSCIRFSSILSKKARILLCKTDPHPLWIAWSGFGQTHLVLKQAGVQEYSGPVPGRDATGSLPVSRFQTRFRSSTDVPDNIVQNQPGSDLVLADCVRFGPNGWRSGSKPVCKNHPARFLPTLPSRWNPANRIRQVYKGRSLLCNST